MRGTFPPFSSLGVTVDGYGKAVDVSALSGPPELLQLSMDAARQWQFALAVGANGWLGVKKYEEPSCHRKDHKPPIRIHVRCLTHNGKTIHGTAKERYIG